MYVQTLFMIFWISSPFVAIRVTIPMIRVAMPSVPNTPSFETIPGITVPVSFCSTVNDFGIIPPEPVSFDIRPVTFEIPLARGEIDAVTASIVVIILIWSSSRFPI